MIAAACVLHNFIIIGNELNIQDEDYLYDEDMEIEESIIIHYANKCIKHFSETLLSNM